MNAKIDAFILNRKIITYAQTKSDFVRLAVIAKYGGIYMDASYFAVENINWIINISKYPSKYVFNRYGELPSVLMLFHPHFGQPF
jgi:mannosyltransferase OCH1-like enzyme